MLKRTVVAATISTVIATVIYVLVQFIYDRRFEAAETVFFAGVAWIIFFVTYLALGKTKRNPL